MLGYKEQSEGVHRSVRVRRTFKEGSHSTRASGFLTQSHKSFCIGGDNEKDHTSSRCSRTMSVNSNLFLHRKRETESQPPEEPPPHSSSDQTTIWMLWGQAKKQKKKKDFWLPTMNKSSLEEWERKENRPLLRWPSLYNSKVLSTFKPNAFKRNVFLRKKVWFTVGCWACPKRALERTQPAPVQWYLCENRSMSINTHTSTHTVQSVGSGVYDPCSYEQEESH